MSEIPVPVISLKPWFTDDETERAKVVGAIKDACLRCGFFMITDHHVDPKVIDQTWQMVRDYFDSPLEVKMETPMAADYPYGYSPLNSELAGGDLSTKYGAADIKEAFNVCLGPAHDKHPDRPAPRWPRAPAGFASHVTAYYREMEKLATELLHIFARALDVPDNFFDEKQCAHWAALRCINYPHLDKPAVPGQLRINQHTDFGVLTLLLADNAPGGLQVQMKDGSWRDVSFPEGAITVNLGDLMQRWTNDQWKSTMHRVVPPEVTPGVDNRRQSIAFFHNLNREAVCETIPSCIDEAHPAKYPPINAFDHLMERHARSIGVSKITVSDKTSDSSGAAATH